MKLITTIIILFFLCFSISAQNTITTNTILQLSTCAGGTVAVPFSTSGNFPFGTTFVAELSNAFGQFNNPIQIGQIPINLGIIPAVIPRTINFGFLYKIRVRTANSSVIGNPCPNTLIITQIALLNEIVISPNELICLGDSVNLRALTPVASYLWSNGETNQSITITEPGVYSVTSTDFLTCKSTTSISVEMKNCQFNNSNERDCNSLLLYPNPTIDLMNIDNIRGNSTNYYKIFNDFGILAEEGILKDNLIKTSDLGMGMYFLRITNTHGFHCGKFIKL